MRRCAGRGFRSRPVGDPTRGARRVAAAAARARGDRHRAAPPTPRPGGPTAGISPRRPVAGRSPRARGARCGSRAPTAPSPRRTVRGWGGDAAGGTPDGASGRRGYIQTAPRPPPGRSAPEEESSVAAGHRLTRAQLAALAPGDPVTVEAGADFGRWRHTTGTVVRTGPSHLVAQHRTPRGGTFIQRYPLRDALRDSGGRAQLVITDTNTPATRDLPRHRTQRIDTANRRRADVEALRELRDANSDHRA